MSANESEIEAAIRAELKPGGRPAQTYRDLSAYTELHPLLSAALTTTIIINLEQRLVTLEEASSTPAFEAAGSSRRE